MLAVLDLWVGVSNDAVNFLNGAVGSKAASFKVIIFVAAVGVFIGAALSNGMMDIARHGIFQPQYFYFSEIMCILVAVMLTDVVLLDIFNSLGMPTSTTVSLVFELVGGTVALSLIKIANSDGAYQLGDLINTEKAFTVIMAIFVSVAIAFVFGAVIGGVSGFIGGKIDTVLMRIVDALMAVPPALLAMAIITAMGNGVFNLVLALAIAQIPRFARTVRSSVLTLRNMEYIEAAKCYGSSSMRTIVKHILPNGIGPIVVSATLTLGAVILSISSMGYLGLGVASPTPEWGTIISENKINIRYYPYLGLIPGLCIMFSVMAVNFIGDGLRDAFDPKSKN